MYKYMPSVPSFTVCFLILLSFTHRKILCWLQFSSYTKTTTSTKLHLKHRASIQISSLPHTTSISTTTSQKANRDRVNDRLPHTHIHTTTSSHKTLHQYNHKSSPHLHTHHKPHLRSDQSLHTIHYIQPQTKHNHHQNGTSLIHRKRRNQDRSRRRNRPRHPSSTPWHKPQKSQRPQVQQPKAIKPHSSSLPNR